MSTTERGRRGEAVAAGYLEDQGYTILDRNWHNRWCELDLVARDPSGIHFIEVKYRRTSAHGSGFEHISYDKASRLRRATAAWVQAHQYDGAYQIDIISLSGDLERPSLEHLPNAITD